MYVHVYVWGVCMYICAPGCVYSMCGYVYVSMYVYVWVHMYVYVWCVCVCIYVCCVVNYHIRRLESSTCRE